MWTLVASFYPLDFELGGPALGTSEVVDIGSY